MKNKIDYIGEEALFFAFQITRTVVFEVTYRRLDGNKDAYFSTTANEFNRPKTDFKRCGQCQEDLLPKHSNAYRFWKKWDKFHLSALTDEQVEELLKDIEKLRYCYNSFRFSDFYKHGHIPFYGLKDLSMHPITKDIANAVNGYYFQGRPKRSVIKLTKANEVSF